MWPWGHVAFGYLLYLLVRPSSWRGADRWALLAVVVGSQAPDLVDKPLAWYFTILPSGRSLGHSLFFAAIVITLVWVVAESYGHREAGIGYAVGHLSHLLGDTLIPIYYGQYAEISFLLWPLLPAPEYEEPSGILDIYLFVTEGLVLSPAILSEVAIGVGVGALCLYHFVRRGTWTPED